MAPGHWVNDDSSQGKESLDFSLLRATDGHLAKEGRDFRRHSREDHGCQEKGDRFFIPRPRDIQATKDRDGDHLRVKVAHTRLPSVGFRNPKLIPVIGSQPAGDVSHKPGGRLPLLSARPAVTAATLKRAVTNFAAW